jgi:hypothetical protein
MMDISVELVKAVKNVIYVFKKEMGIEDEPLDGDEVEALTNLFRIIANRNEGNLTDEEYEMELQNILEP